MGREIPKGTGHSRNRGRGKGSRVVVAPLQHRKDESTLHGAEEHRGLCDADALGLDAGQPDAAIESAVPERFAGSVSNVNYLKSIDYTPPNRLRLVLTQHLKLVYIHH